MWRDHIGKYCAVQRLENGSAEGAERVARVEARLRASFAPDHLEVDDESHHHRGHAGAKDGRAHLRVRIVAGRFSGVSRIERHRMVYLALGEELESEVHALAIQVLTPEEWASRSR